MARRKPAAPPVVRHWIVCADYAQATAGEPAGQRRVAEIERTGACPYEHRVVASATKPEPSPSLSERYRAWSAPFLADPRDEEANAARTRETRELAAEILGAPAGTKVGPMTIAAAGWSAETAEAASQAGEPGSPEWTAALGTHEDALLTSDGKPVIRSAGCSHMPAPPGESWIRYEVFTAKGMKIHGYACPRCRRWIQAS
jgi:hypothetical protein